MNDKPFECDATVLQDQLNESIGCQARVECVERLTSTNAVLKRDALESHDKFLLAGDLCFWPSYKFPGDFIERVFVCNEISSDIAKVSHSSWPRCPVSSIVSGETRPRAPLTPSGPGHSGKMRGRNRG